MTSMLQDSLNKPGQHASTVTLQMGALPGISLDSRRIRSWSPPTEGRGLSYVETVGGSRWMPRPPATECARMIPVSQPASPRAVTTECARLREQAKLALTADGAANTSDHAIPVADRSAVDSV